MNKILKKIIGAVVALIFLVVYFADRAICIFIPVVNNFDIRIWFNDEEEIRNSLIRTIVVSTVTGLTLAVRYLIINF